MIIFKNPKLTVTLNAKQLMHLVVAVTEYAAILNQTLDGTDIVPDIVYADIAGTIVGRKKAVEAFAFGRGVRLGLSPIEAIVILQILGCLNSNELTNMVGDELRKFITNNQYCITGPIIEALNDKKYVARKY